MYLQNDTAIHVVIDIKSKSAANENHYTIGRHCLKSAITTYCSLSVLSNQSLLPITNYNHKLGNLNTIT